MESLDQVLLVNRLALGVFFACSGFNKVCNKGRHASLVRTLRRDEVPLLPFNQWLIPGAEFMGGCALIVGFLTPLAALGLFIICLGAIILDGVERIPAMRPINFADRVACFFYLPEVLYGLMLLTIAASWGGPWSIDGALLRWVR